MIVSLAKYDYTLDEFSVMYKDIKIAFYNKTKKYCRNFARNFVREHCELADCDNALKRHIYDFCKDEILYFLIQELSNEFCKKVRLDNQFKPKLTEQEIKDCIAYFKDKDIHAYENDGKVYVNFDLEDQCVEISADEIMERADIFNRENE
ncbi:hypothetical protein [Campylobacter sp. MIT 97-5078]|uniref:hypothetical protein n=1 Tax=Campylobacter sp. MIT 97-5078 TaxID=1548153 RepID=UPI0005148A83|nr:hypothetical protein [Campylobacter sp. MIT 97-5078]KGI57347.1 hypothetical protein LR59_01040 [Campylobacter sp. MIT 97-5078]TQR27432.1 hypothetical protein DMB91_04030 [Campylobacter sp. MIT 97-5078]